MDRLLQDLRFAVRMLARRRGFTLVATLTLALGIGITTAIFSVVNGILLRPLPYADPDRIIALWQADKVEPSEELGGYIPHANYLDWKQASTTIAEMGLYARTNLTLTGLGEAEMVPGGRVTAGFFEVFGEPLALGRPFTSEEDRPEGPHAVIVSHGFWQDRLGGRADVLGSTVTLGGDAWTVVGVAAPGFAFPGETRLWIPARNDDESCGRGCVYLQGVGRLAPGATLEQARTELRAIAARLEQEHPLDNTDVSAGAATLRDLMVGDVRRGLYVLLAAVGMVLLIACANVANLLLARGTSRRGELAVRAALGAGRRRLLSQLMTENVLLAVVGGLVGVGLASWGVEALRSIAPASIPRTSEIGLDGTALGFAFALVVGTALLFGLAPALQLARAPLAGTLRTAGRSGMQGRTFGRSAILVAEVGLSIVLLLGAGLLLRSFARMQQVDTGYDAQHVAHFSITVPQARYETPERQLQVYEELGARLAALPGVQSVGAALGVPLSGSVYSGSFDRPELPPPTPDNVPVAMVRPVTASYMQTLAIRIVRGRGIEPTDRHASVPVAVISRAAAGRYWPGEDPIGKQLNLQISFGFEEEQARTIVGIAEDIRSIGVISEPEAELYVPLAQTVPGSLTFVIRARGTANVLEAARAELRAVDPDIPMVRPGSLEELVAADLAPSRFYLLLLALFAGLAVVLAAVGLYGVVAYLVSHRTREIGVRMALGARWTQVVGEVVWQGMRPALLGVVIGAAVALAGVRVLRSLLYEIQPQDPLTLVAVVTLLAAVALVACAIPAWRAARIAPASALRSE
jgi:predicted permease